MVRYVINEHWPYYQYETIGLGDDWLRKKKGRLLFRLANWRQPHLIASSNYREYLQAGCHKAHFTTTPPCGHLSSPEEGKAELVCLGVENGWRDQVAALYNKVDNNTLLMVDDIWKDKEGWREIQNHPRTTVSFDLYYCGIVLFDEKRNKQHYTINF
jgi:hypothetical protein